SLYALVFVSLAGGLQAVAWALRHGRLFEVLRASLVRAVRPLGRRRSAAPPQYIPYAVAIAMGTAATLLFRGFCVAVALALAVAPTRAEAESTIHLGVGTQKVLKVRGGIARIAVGNPAVADVRPLGDKEILIVGVREGRTTLLVWRNSGAQESHLLVVRKVSTEDLADEVRALLGDREGLYVRAAGDQVIIDGEAHTPEDHRRVQAVLELYPDVRSMARVAPTARRLAVEEINRELQRAGLRHVFAQVVGARLFLEGHVESEADLRKAELIVAALGETAENLVQVGLRRLVLAEVHFLEVRRARMRQLGIRFPFDVAGSAAAAASIQGSIADGRVIVGSYDALVEGTSAWSVRAAVDKGFGRLLAQPTLLCASGEEAEFLAGGEVPLPLVTQTSNTVEYRKYGVVLRLRPTADRHGNILTEIEAEVSELDRSVAVAVGPNVSVPGFRNRSVKTSVTVRNGETIVLSGVYTVDEQKSISKVPLLGDIPLVGELFKQRSLDDAERELLIFVTPRLVNPESDAVVRSIESMRRTHTEAESEVGFDLLD
ncbi:MAG TPA: pilus assembly protein N-terminal domain-containing protein, partial [Fredinandcohnia sp.]|nr:pilus assembly protein N-terminal domain-containing protein [Fredinandcohnia sp.]